MAYNTSYLGRFSTARVNIARHFVTGRLLLNLVRKIIYNIFAERFDMKKFLLTLIISGPLVSTGAIANDADEKAAVVEVVRTFFEAMTAKDSEKSSAVMTTDGVLYGYRENDAGLQIIRPTHADYLEGLATRENELIERFWEPTVLLHERMAVVWTPYDLYVDGEFSHCGIDNFSLLKLEQGWKITGIVFSMEADNCPTSPLGPLQKSK